MHLFNWAPFSLLAAKFGAFLLSLGLFIHFIASVASGNSIVYVQQTPPALSLTAVATTSLVIKAAATSSVQATKAIKAPATLPTQKQTATKITPPATATAPAAPVSATLDLANANPSSATIEQLNTDARASLVNILCTTGAGGSFEPISGSGVIVDSRGIILTNAHVAQYFLLKDFPVANNVQCVIRTGSPAQAMYTAQVMYLPPEWVAANASDLTTAHPTGTGENDYAFLQITGAISSSASFQASFPALSMTSATPQVGAPVLLAAYPAQLLDGQSIQMDLYSSSAVSTVQDLYSFDGLQHADLIALGGSVVSQTGSSGGALVGIGSGKLLGIIATETTGTTTADRQLNAVTVSYIDRQLSAEGFGGLTSFLSQDPSQQTTNFQSNIAPQETAQLEAPINKAQN